MNGSGQPPLWQPAPPTPPWAAAPVRKPRRSRWLTVGLPLGVVLLLGGCSALTVFAVLAAKDSLGPAQDAAGEYATALVEQRWEDAHALLCEPSRSEISADDLEELYRDPALSGYRVEGVNVRSSNGRTTGDVTLAFETESGLADRTFLPLVKVGEEWQPCP